MNSGRLTTTLTTLATLAGILLATNPTFAGVVFSESFEAPVVSSFSSNTIPSGGKWIVATAGFGASNRGLYNQAVTWPATPVFSTPFGAQAYYINYSNSGLTTAVNATGQTLTAGVTYKVSFNAAVVAGTSSGSYQVELVAFAAADDNAARANCQAARPGTILATATGTVITNTMSGSGQLVFTPAAGNAHLGKDLGIRLIKSNNSVLHDNIRLVTGHDMNPTPASGVTLAGGNVLLNWTNMPPTSGTDVYVDVWFGTNPAALTKVVNGALNTISTTVTAPSANTYYWRVDSYLGGSATGSPVTGDVFVFIVIDTDSDGFPDTYELANTTPPSNTALNPADDLDTDGLTNMLEFQYATNPRNSDTDSDTLLDGPEISGVAPRPPTNPRILDTDADGLSDGAENNSGIWVSASNTGTNPADADRDKDGLKDGVEKKTGTFVSRTTDTGTDPYLTDTDADGAGDWYEVAATFTNPNSAAEKSPIPYPLPDPDASTGAANKPVKVYIMSGQSNMVGIGYVNGGEGSLDTIAKRDNKFPNLVNSSNAWTVRNDVIYKGLVTATAAGPLSAGQGADSSRVGPELGFGQVMGWFHDEPVLIIKSSQGNRSLGWDFLPPGSPSFNYTDGNTYAGYGQSPLKWTTGSTPVPINWQAGIQYDECFDAAHTILNNGVLQNLPTGTGSLNGRAYEIAGFVWWQGHKDQYEAAHYTRYESNLANLIAALRTEFNAPSAPFVVGTIGFDGGNYALNTPYDYIYKAQKAISDPAKHPEFVGNVKSVDTTGYWRTLAESPGTQGFHYNNNAETYTLVGDALGRAMLDLLNDVAPPVPNPLTFATAPTPINTTTVGMTVTTASDPSGPVEYYFENTTNSTNSGWITTTSWNSSSLTNGVSHLFRVKARDSKGNETGWSATASAAPGSDVTAPLPDPMSFATPPNALGQNTIIMTASTATDVNGVEYYFDCTTAGGHDSVWQDSPTYTDTALTPSTQYFYQVRARDKSTGQNATAYSAAASATTGAPDSTPPSPNPTSFATPPTAQGENAITMTAATATDVSGIEYFFDATNGGHDSLWQDSPIYTDTGLSPETTYSYRVQARDKSPAQNATTFSATASATTDAPDITPPAILSMSPADNAIDVPVANNLVITFTETIDAGSGFIIIKNLTDSTQAVIGINDAAQVILSGAVLTINPTTNFLTGKNFAVRIDATAFQDNAGNPFPGINNDTTWNFTSAVVPHVWTQTAGNAQDWTTGTNWLAGNAPNPISGDTVDFSTVNIAANTTLTLGADRTAQLWKFGDTSSTQTWTVNTGNRMILAGTTPTIQVNNNTTTLNTIVDGTAGLTKTGGGILSLANTANTYTGGTTINGGNLTIASDGSLGSGTVTVNANTSITLPNNFTFNRGFVINNGASVITNVVSAVVTVNGAVTGTGSIAPFNQSNANLTLASTANTFTGSFQLASGIQQGTIIVNSIGDGGTVFLGGTGYGQANFRYGTGATAPLVLNTRTITLGTAGGGKGVIQNDNTANSNANTITINTDLLAPLTGDRTMELGGANTGTNAFAGKIINGAGTVSLNKAGVGTWVLGNAGNTFSGTMTLNSTTTSAGTLAYASAAGTNPITFLQTTGSATLSYTGAAPLTMSGSITAPALTTGTITLNASGVTPADTIHYSNPTSLSAVTTNSGARNIVLGGTNTGNNIFNGAFTNNITGTTTLTKNGAGTWVLTGANTHTGNTTVSAGKLFVNGSTASSNVSVSANATLGGTGTIGGNTTIAVTGKLEFNLSTAAANHDKLDLAATKTLTFSGASVLTITSSSGAFPGDYTLLTAPGGFGSSVAPATVNLPPGWTAQAPRFVGTDLKINVTSTGGNTYATWLATFPGAAAMPGFTQDADADGIKNGVENFFGTNPGVFSSGMVAGAKSGNTFTFTHPQNSTPGTDVTAAYRWSKDLTSFNASGATDGAGTTVTFTTQLNTPTPGITTVTATVTGTAATKLLVDVKVTQN